MTPFKTFKPFNRVAPFKAANNEHDHESRARSLEFSKRRNDKFILPVPSAGAVRWPKWRPPF
jgi:hypothetical protein